MRDYFYGQQLNRKTAFLNSIRRIFRFWPLERTLRLLVSGRRPDHPLAKLIPPEYLYNKGAWREITRDGSALRLDISNAVDHWTYFNLADAGDEKFMALIKPGDTVLDIGANIGTRTLAFARAARNGRVVSFEPHPGTFRRLEDHVLANAVTNVSPVCLAIGSKQATERLLEVVPSNPGMNRIIRAEDHAGQFSGVDVRVSPLEPVLMELGVGRVDAIKVDVEGFEMEVIRGSLGILEKYHPALFIELDDDNLRENGSSARELLDKLGQLGYSVVRADDGTGMPADLSHCHFDILCTSPGTT